MLREVMRSLDRTQVSNHKMTNLSHKLAVSITAWAYGIGGLIFFLLLFKYPFRLFELSKKLGNPLDFLYGLVLVMIASLLPKAIVIGLRRFGAHDAIFSVLVFFWLMNVFIVWFFILK